MPWFGSEVGRFRTRSSVLSSLASTIARTTVPTACASRKEKRLEHDADAEQRLHTEVCFLALRSDKSSVPQSYFEADQRRSASERTRELVTAAPKGQGLS